MNQKTCEYQEGICIPVITDLSPAPPTPRALSQVDARRLQRRLRTDILDFWSQFADTFEDEEPGALVDPNPPTCHAAILKRLDDPLVRAIVFLPHPDVV